MFRSLLISFNTVPIILTAMRSPVFYVNSANLGKALNKSVWCYLGFGFFSFGVVLCFFFVVVFFFFLIK